MAEWTASSHWFPFRRGASTARLRLFCFPYAGAGASVFRDWPALLGVEAEVYPAQPPGREERLGETSYVRLQPLVADLADAMPWDHGRVDVYFGHSMGALIAFELAHELRRRGMPGPSHLILSGHGAVHVQKPTARYLLSDDLLLEEIDALQGTPAELLADRDIMEFFLPLIRADMELCETYEYASAPKLTCSITALGGVEDHDVARSDLDAWAELTTGRCRVRMFPGGHFFIHPFARDVLREVTDDLAGVDRRVRGGSVAR